MKRILIIGVLAILPTLACISPTCAVAPAVCETTPNPEWSITETPEALPAATEIPPHVTDTCTVQTGVPAGWLNLRSGPGLDYGVLRVLTEGETLVCVNECKAPGGWIAVTEGYVKAEFCR